MGKSSISGNLSAQVRNEIIDEITIRAAALGLKKGTYTNLVLEWWAAQGFPAISEPDRLMQLAKHHAPKATKRAG